MKKLIAIGVFLLVLLSVVGQEVVYTNQVTIEWDAVAPMGGDAITYEVWQDDGATQTLLGETAGLYYTVTFGTEGSYVLGVRTVRTITATGERLYSDMNWSDEDGEATPNPFVVRYYVPPVAPGNLRRQQ